MSADETVGQADAPKDSDAVPAQAGDVPTDNTPPADAVIDVDFSGSSDGPAVTEASDDGDADTVVEDTVEGVDPDEVVPMLVEEDPRDQRINELEDRVGELEARLRAVSKAYTDNQAEITATRERLERRAAVQEEMRRGEVVASLFDPMENLRRSLDAVGKGATVEDTAKGVELVLGQFMSAFHKMGLEEVPGKGARFDPTLHEALTMVPVTDAALDEVVIDVFSAGYRIGSRLISPARVIVGRFEEPAAEA